MTSLRIQTSSVVETHALGKELARQLRGGMIIAMSGNLGAGKTTLTQGIAAGLGVAQRVTSPTYTLVNEYELDDGRTLIHIDSYRLSSGKSSGKSCDESDDNSAESENPSDESANWEAATFGFEELLEIEDAVVVIEWAERLAGLLPADRLHVSIVHGAEAAEPDAAVAGEECEDFVQEGMRTIQLHAHGTNSAGVIAALRQ